MNFTTLNKKDILEWQGIRLVRISAVPGLKMWLRGQTIPVVEGQEEPYDWCYYSDYERFIKRLPIID